MSETPIGLDLPSGAVLELPDLTPVRMLNEFTYCPRLAYLMWVQGEFADNLYTVDGRYKHRRVDQPSGDIPQPEETDGETIHARSVQMSAPGIGLIARIDMVELDGNRTTPVDYKRGKAPDLEEGAYEPERVQLCAQALILRENGYTCDEGIIYFVGSKRRVPIQFDETLVKRTLDRLAQMRATAAAGKIPSPLPDSPKCPRCSLVGICLPDEVNLLAATPPPSRRSGGGYLAELRRLVPTEQDALPMYVQSQGATITKDGDLLQIRENGHVVQEARLGEVSQVAVFGNVQVTARTISEVCRRGIPITHYSFGGWFHGITHGMSHKNVELRRRQYAVAEDPDRCLHLARAFVSGKIRNCRTLLRRNHPSSPQDTLEHFQ